MGRGGAWLASPGYSLGFVIVILGRQELFTESTLTAVLPLLVRRDRATWVALLRFWAIVLGANLLGTLVFARLLAIDGLFPEPVRTALSEIGRNAVSGPFWPTAIKAVFAGWLIALMVWLLPSARSARLLVIMLLTYVVAIGGFSHVIAGSVEAAFAIFAGHASVKDYLGGFFRPHHPRQHDRRGRARGAAQSRAARARIAGLSGQAGRATACALRPVATARRPIPDSPRAEIRDNLARWQGKPGSRAMWPSAPPAGATGGTPRRRAPGGGKPSGCLERRRAPRRANGSSAFPRPPT